MKGSIIQQICRGNPLPSGLRFLQPKASRLKPPSSPPDGWRPALALILSLGLIFPCHAHKVSSASVILELDTKKERNFLVSVATQVESSGDAQLDDQISPEQAARTFVETSLEVLVDEVPQPSAISTQLINTSDPNTPANLRRMEVLVEWKGKLPSGGRELMLFLKETAEMNLVLLVKKDGVAARRLQVMLPGEYSRAETIEPLMTENPFEAEPAASALPPAPERNQPAASLFPAGAAKKAGGSGFMKKFRAGAAAALHPMFLPAGLLAALLLAAVTPRALVFSLVLFVLAQSLGASLTGLGVMPVFPWSGAAAFACLFLIAADNLMSKEARSWRCLPATVGAFAAGTLAVNAPSFAEVGIPPVAAGSLVPFQAGFEAVLLLVALLSGAVLGLSAKSQAARGMVLVPLSIVLAGTAAYFFLENYTAVARFF